MTNARLVVDRVMEWLPAVVPAVVLFSLFFALDGNLRWLGLFGFLPLLLASQGCRTCGGAGRSCNTRGGN